MVHIEHYTAERIPDPNGNVSPWDFYKVRNAVVRTCRLHGPTGPMGLLDLDKADGSRGLFDIWEPGDPDAVYCVLDDQHNDERYQYVECDADFFTEQWILDLMGTLKEYPFWGIGICCIPMAYVLVFAEKLMVKGLHFENVNDLATLVVNARYAIANKEKEDTRTKAACKNFWFEDDTLFCEAEHLYDPRRETISIHRDSVRSVWRNPFIGNTWTLSFKDGGFLELSNEDAFMQISEWFQSAAD